MAFRSFGWADLPWSDLHRARDSVAICSWPSANGRWRWWQKLAATGVRGPVTFNATRSVLHFVRNKLVFLTIRRCLPWSG